MTGSAWRVQPLPRIAMAVVVDAWHELTIPAADHVHGRIDVIVQRPLPSEFRDPMVIAGTPGGGRPAIPKGFVPIAAISVPRGVSAVAHCHIADP